MVSLIFSVIECLPVIIFSCDSSPLIAVVPQWSRHLFLGCLREWDSLCCSFGTGLSDDPNWCFTIHLDLFR
jgi:hypothetical protein